MLVDDIALTLQPSVGPRTAAYLVARFGSAGAVYGASKQELVERAELREWLAAEIVAQKWHRQAEREIEYCRDNGIRPIVCDDEAYPALLRECGDHPHVLYFRGDERALGRRMLSIVGTRKSTPYGQKACEAIIGGLADVVPEVVVVSGLAYGIDAAAHRTALSHGVATVGVLANPVMSISPTHHTAMAEEMIRRGGGVLSEYHSQERTNGAAFVPRNRIIAGMSMGTVVVESQMKGGSMITANMAHGYNRVVMAVPGRAGDPASEGPNHLIRSNKAVMVCSGADVAAELMWDGGGVDGSASAKDTARDLSTLSGPARRVLEALDGRGQEVVPVDDLMEMVGMGYAQLSPLLLELEFEGMIRALPGKVYEKL